MKPGVMDIETSMRESSRTRWTPALDKIFADLVVQQIELGNRQNNVFNRKTWTFVRNEFNKLTNLDFNNNQMRKHLEVLRRRYCSLKSSRSQNEFVIGDTSGVGFDLWDDIGVQPRTESVKVKDCPIYDQLCTIFANTTVDGCGQYAQSSHFEGLDTKPIGSLVAGFSPGPDGKTMDSDYPLQPKLEHGDTSFLEKGCADAKGKKRKRWPETNTLYQTMGPAKVRAMAGALFDMAAAAKMKMDSAGKADDGFSISNCIEELDEIENVDDTLYLAALDLFENHGFRETFLSLKDDRIRLRWLQSKCAKPTITA